MIDEDGRERFAASVPRETLAALDIFVGLLGEAATEHNLIARSTLDELWTRHIADAAQLPALAPGEGLWADIGSGGGLPGIVVALLTRRPVLLIEPRRLRADFLRHAVDVLGLGSRVRVRQQRAETIRDEAAAVISARAVAPLDRLFAIGARLATADTIWVLPKGRTTAAEVASAARIWHASIMTAASSTDPAARIVVATGVRPRRA